MFFLLIFHENKDRIKNQFIKGIHMINYLILSFVGAFFYALPVQGSAETDLFEEELGAFKKAHTAFDLHPCVTTFNESYLHTTPLLTSMQRKIERDLQELTLQYGTPLWTMACAQIKILFPAQPTTFDESQTLDRYTLKESTEEENHDKEQKEVSLLICQARASDTAFMESALQSKEKLHKFLEEKTEQLRQKMNDLIPKKKALKAKARTL